VPADQPLVSVGLPTYNRAALLKQAIASVLAQDYSNLELVISDNGSSDDTQRMCEEFRARDDRVKYFRQSTNRGPRANGREVLRQSHGYFFMWMGDDDRLATSYLERCVHDLMENPDYSLVCGSTKYYKNGLFFAEGVAVNLLQDSAEERLLAFYKQWSDNPAFYGVMRRELARLVWPPKVLGPDLLLVAALAFIGKIKTNNETLISVSYSGMSRNLKEICAETGISGIHALVPRLSTAISAAKDVAWGSGPYASIGRWARLSLAFKVWSVFYRRFWHDHLAHPTRSAVLVRNKIREKYWS
jgi:glycosyltransferase involved in cell wall biosynthesis